MIALDLGGAAAIVTGGTRGLGLAIGHAFARAGATVFLTHRWGSADEGAIRAGFAEAALPEPHIIEADASDRQATGALLRYVAERAGSVHAVVSNVAFAGLVDDAVALKRSALELSLGYSAWPVVDLVQATRAETGRWPRYVVGISSDGADVCHPGYALAGASKAVLETLCRYLAVQLRHDGVRVNVVRPGLLDTASARATFGDAAVERAVARAGGVAPAASTVAQTVLALCSGLMDAVNGQIITADGGASLVSPLEPLSADAAAT